MENKKVSEFFLGKREMKLIEGRVKLLEKIMEEIRGNEELMGYSSGKVWKWFKVMLWKPILVESGLSDEGKLNVMRMCIGEKVKYKNMGDKGMKGFVGKMIVEVKLGERKGRVNGDRGKDEGEGEPSEEVAIEKTDVVIAA
jgi:hypothetical protein